MEEGVAAAIDGLSQRLIGGERPVIVDVNNAQAIRQELDRVKREECIAPLRAAAESLRPVSQWAAELQAENRKRLDSVRSLEAMAEKILPIVLVVDDDEFQQQVVGRVLAAQKYRLVFASSGVEALSMLRTVRPDVILMDVVMPELDGIETIRRIRLVPHLAKVPVIVCTSKAEVTVVTRSKSANASDFVVKPYDPSTLIGKITRILNSGGASGP